MTHHGMQIAFENEKNMLVGLITKLDFDYVLNEYFNRDIKFLCRISITHTHHISLSLNNIKQASNTHLSKQNNKTFHNKVDLVTSCQEILYV